MTNNNGLFQERPGALYRGHWLLHSTVQAASSQVVRLSLMAVPTLTILVMAIVVLRHFWRVDEFIRRLMLECFAVAGAFAFMSTLTYGIFEIAGFPKISMWWGFGGTALVWNLWMLRLVRR